MSSYYCSLRERGQAMTEFIIVIPVLILLIFGAVQIAFIYSAKTTLNYATFQAARVGSTNHATYSALRRGLIRGLAPLYTSNSDIADMQDDIRAGMDSSGAKRDAITEIDTYTRIIRISPTAGQFESSQFGEDNGDGVMAIPNDTLMYRPNWESDGATIQDANLLKIRVQYCYKLMVPIVNKIIGSLSELNNTRPASAYNSYETEGDPRFVDQNRGVVDDAAGVTAGYDELCGDRAENSEGFVIFAEATVRMQSAAYEEDTDEDWEDVMCDGNKMACP